VNTTVDLNEINVKSLQKLKKTARKYVSAIYLDIKKEYYGIQPKSNLCQEGAGSSYA
jgi:hypothetical protein